jgi:hypothetical protein
MYVSIFWTIKYERNSCLNWMVSLQVLPHSLNWFFLPKPDFLEFISNFSDSNHFKINISHILKPNLTKQIPLNPAHQDLSNKIKGTFQFLQNFQWRNHSIFKNFYTASPDIMEPSPCTHSYSVLVESFPKTQRTQSEAPLPSVDLITTIQNKLPSFIDRSSNQKNSPTVLWHVVTLYTKLKGTKCQLPKWKKLKGGQ